MPWPPTIGGVHFRAAALPDQRARLSTLLIHSGFPIQQLSRTEVG